MHFRVTKQQLASCRDEYLPKTVTETVVAWPRDAVLADLLPESSISNLGPDI